MILRLSRIPYLRTAVQLAFFIAAVYLFLNLDYPVSMPVDNIFLSSDPLVALTSIIFYRGAWIPALLPVIALLAGSMVLGRVFCGWICPVGFLVDVSGAFSGIFSKIIKRRQTRARFGYLQYGILAAVLISALFTLEALSILDPFVILQRSLHMIWSSAGIPIIILLLLAASIVIAPRFWCRAICPTGAIIGAASLISPFGLKINEDCIKCKKCHRECPTGAISGEMKWDATACTKCLVCERVCPKDAISFSASVPSISSFSTSRRSLLAAGAALGLFAVSKGAVAASSSGKPIIRPPGSLVEYSFNAACTRCESCARVCLGNVIRPAGLDAGIDRYYTPVLDFSTGKCERCGACGTVCPTGAIISVPEEKIKIGTASVDTEKCIAWKDNLKCLICSEVCPVDAIKGVKNLRPRVIPEVCVGCGACELNCPVDGVKAITVSNAGERRREA
ncbi:hypothetical protein CUJ83_06755 [Methanocella sp. CWC-04]|uniref:4Fe-4S ferredoxin-type domain-containing protein n=1 Tax=Methanooceanicella nereidis TaxID=2052831 RepID=A0AAP2RCD8_9EURY|nr:4Fe-4S binding protein [Methanocella sp. CWC-04]MCD1294699.1 hypothetical protein [Methanocella sp. CWC-04]